MQAGDIVAAIDLGTSRTAYAYTVVGREHIWLGVPDSPDDDRNVSTYRSTGLLWVVVAGDNNSKTQTKYNFEIDKKVQQPTHTEKSS